MDSREAVEAELIQRNREIAKVRDQLVRRETEVHELKARNDDLLGKVAEMDGEMTKLRQQMREVEEARDKSDADLRMRGAAGDLEAALTRVVMLEQKSMKLEGQLLAECDAREAAEEKVKYTTDVQNSAITEERRKCAAAETALATAESEASSTQAKVAQLEAQVRQGERQLAIQRDESETLRTRVAHLEGELVEEAAKLQTATATTSRELEVSVAREREAAEAHLKSCKDDAQKAADAHREERRNIQEELEQRSAALEVEKRAKDSLSRQLQLEKTEVELCREQLREVDVARGTMEAEKIRLQTRSDDLERQVNEQRALLEGQKAHKNDMLTREQELKNAIMDKELRIMALEAEATKKSSTDKAVSSDLEARIQALQAEAKRANSEAQRARTETRECREGLAMVAEEMYIRDFEASQEIGRLRMQLDETRRARSIEMRAMIHKMILPVDEQGSSAGSSPQKPGYPGGRDALAATAFI